jgi:putative ABC transport system permease protein
MMLGYYVRLAGLSFRRNPGLTALMVLAIALGIAVCVVTLTVYHATSGNPIWWKNDRLYAVTLDSWDPNEPADKQHPQLPPEQLTYKDATFLFNTPIPQRKVVMYKTGGTLSGGTAENKPTPALVRLTTADFFGMFEVPFLYGSGWSAAVDQNPEPVLVLSKSRNEKLFGGANSVGRTIRWDDREFRIIGVLDDWLPQPKYYDLNNGNFDEPEDAYAPFAWGNALEKLSAGNTNCWKPEDLNTFKQFQNSECIWTQMWVELPDAATRERMQDFMDAYWADQRKSGRFQRPQNNRLTNVSQWLVDHEVVSRDNRILVALAFAFLAVCLFNTGGLLLAKFLNNAPTTGVRRALGASRRAVFTQHLVEVSALAVVGAALGLLLGGLGLWGVRALYATAIVFQKRGGYQELAHFDASSIVTALVLTVLTALAAGLYPAWRIGRLPPAGYLKSQ